MVLLSFTPLLESGVLRSVCPSVCLSVCEHISLTAAPIFTKFFAQIPCDLGSVLLWRRFDMLCTSGFMDDVTFGRSGPYGASGVATSGRSLTSMNALFWSATIYLKSKRLRLPIRPSHICSTFVHTSLKENVCNFVEVWCKRRIKIAWSDNGGKRRLMQNWK